MLRFKVSASRADDYRPQRWEDFRPPQILSPLLHGVQKMSKDKTEFSFALHSPLQGGLEKNTSLKIQTTECVSACLSLALYLNAKSSSKWHIDVVYAGQILLGYIHEEMQSAQVI